jgi:hypothetical protein
MIRTEYRVTVGCDEPLCWDRIVISTTHELQRPALHDAIRSRSWFVSPKGALTLCTKHTRGKDRR